MYLRCDCGKLINLEKGFIDGMAAEKEGKKIVLCANTLMTAVECKCKKVYIIEIGRAVFKKAKLKKGPLKGKTVAFPRNKRSK